MSDTLDRGSDGLSPSDRMGIDAHHRKVLCCVEEVELSDAVAEYANDPHLTPLSLSAQGSNFIGLDHIIICDAAGHPLSSEEKVRLGIDMVQRGKLSYVTGERRGNGLFPIPFGALQAMEEGDMEPGDQRDNPADPLTAKTLPRAFLLFPEQAGAIGVASRNAMRTYAQGIKKSDPGMAASINQWLGDIMRSVYPGINPRRPE